MRIKTIKTLFITLLMCLSSVGAWADTKIKLYSTDFESGIASDYWKNGNGYLVTPTNDGSTGVCASIKNSSDKGDYFLTNADYTDVDNYSIEFDFLLNKGSKTAELAVMSESAWSSWTFNWGYKWDNNRTQAHNPYLLYLSIAGNSTTAVFNDSETTYTFTSGKWYHFKLDIDALNSKVEFSIVQKGESTSVLTGEYTLLEGESPYCKGFYERNNRYNYDPGAICLDNVDIYTVVQEDVAQNPVIKLKKVNGTARTYSISFFEGETLHYKLPGSDEYLTTTETPFEVTVDESGILYAYTTKGTATSEVVETIVDATEIVLPTPEIRVGITQDGNKFIPSFGAVCDNSSVLLNPEITISATLDGVDVTSAVVAGNYTPANSGMLTVTATAEGYTSSTSNMFVAAEYSRSWQSVDFSTITIENVAEYFGDGWSQSANTGRWASWADQAYSYLEYKTNTGSSITVNDRIRMRDVVSVVVGYGLGRNVSGNEQIRVLDVKANEITEFRIYNGYGHRSASEGSYLSYVVGDGGDVYMYSNNGALMVQASVYTPMTETTFTIDYKTKEGVLIKSETVESTTGSSIEISEEQKATFFNDDKTIKYYYAEDDSEGKKVMGDGSTVVTIIVDEAVVATTIHDFEDENTIFTGRSRISIACEYNEEQGSNVCKFTNAGNAQNGYCFANYNIESLTKYANKVIINFDYKPGGRSYVTIGDASIRGNTGGSSKSTYSNIGAIFRVGMNKDNAQVNSINLDRNKFEGNWLNVNVEIDTLSKKVSYIIKQKSDGTIITEGTEVDYYNASAAKCTQVDFFDYINNAVSYIDNITITTESVYVIQQLNYQTEEGTILKSDNVKSFGVIRGIPLVIKYEDSYYTLDDDRLSDYSLDVRSNHLDETVTVNYRHSPDVVFFREGESSQGTDARYSSGGSGTVAAQNKRDRGISVGTLPVGEYEFIVNIPTEEINKRSLVIRQSQNDPLASVGLSNADMTTGIKTAIFKLTEETSSLFINGANSGTEKTNLSVLFDYVMVKIKSVPLTLTSAGVSTLCSPYNLDFTDAQNVAAYKAEIDEENGKIRLEKVTTVAAREGVLIRSLSGEAVTEDVPASASAFELNEGNDFIGTLVNINNQASEDEEYRYYILGGKKNAEGNMVYGFYLAGGKNIGAGKAYLKVPKSAAAKFSFFALDDETTGIEDIHAVQHDDSKVYDLSGRRVMKHSKGLYIKNGKKFIVK